MNSKICIFSLLASFGLYGCGGVADHISTHHLSVRGNKAGQTFTASIKPYPEGTFDSPQTLTTDLQGDANAEFRSRWASAFLIIPPIGNVPWRAPKPSYLISAHGKDTVLLPTSPLTTYRWRGGAWLTETALPLP